MWLCLVWHIPGVGGCCVQSQLPCHVPALSPAPGLGRAMSYLHPTTLLGKGRELREISVLSHIPLTRQNGNNCSEIFYNDIQGLFKAGKRNVPQCCQAFKMSSNPTKTRRAVRNHSWFYQPPSPSPALHPRLYLMLLAFR